MSTSGEDPTSVAPSRPAGERSATNPSRLADLSMSRAAITRGSTASVNSTSTARASTTFSKVDERMVLIAASTRRRCSAGSGSMPVMAARTPRPRKWAGGSNGPFSRCDSTGWVSAALSSLLKGRAPTTMSASPHLSAAAAAWASVNVRAAPKVRTDPVDRDSRKSGAVCGLSANMCPKFTNAAGPRRTVAVCFSARESTGATEKWAGALVYHGEHV